MKLWNIWLKIDSSIKNVNSPILSWYSNGVNIPILAQHLKGVNNPILGWQLTISKVGVMIHK